MVENLDLVLLHSEKAQSKLKELIEKSEEGYVDTIHNIVFSKLQLEDLLKDETEDATEEKKKSVKLTREWVESQLRSNQWWKRQYEVAIPYFKTLLKSNDNN